VWLANTNKRGEGEMTQKLAIKNVGVVGYGYWGTNLARVFMELPGARLSVIVEPNAQRAELARQRYPGVMIVERLEDALEDPALDAVAIATQVDTHFELAMAALKAGKHVWVEKPMTETSAQARLLVGEAERRNLTLLVDHTFIYSGAVGKMAEIVSSGDFGDVLYYDSMRINLGLFQRDVNVISDLAVHDFAILQYLLGETPAAVSASGMTHFEGVPENLAYVSLFYDSGIIAHANVSWLAPVKVRQVLLGGSKKMIVYDDISPSEKVKVYDSGVTFTSDPQEIYQRRVGYRTGDVWVPKINPTEPLRVAGENFLQCIETGAAPTTDGRFGLSVVELIEAATTSMNRRGEAVHIGAKEKVYDDSIC
jgi:predicted dehydrogenase